MALVQRISGFQFHQNRFFDDHIRQVISHNYSVIKDVIKDSVRRLLGYGQPGFPEFNGHCIFIDLFKESRAECIRYFVCCTDNRFGYLVKSACIRVHRRKDFAPFREPWGYISSKLPEEAQIVGVEIADVLDAVMEHGRAFHT